MLRCGSWGDSGPGEYIGRRILLRDSHDIVQRLEREGFELVSVAGPSRKYGHPARQMEVIVPHPRRDLPIETVRTLYRDVGSTSD